MGKDLSDAEQLLLSHINPRRFDLLLSAARLGGTFTAPEIKAAAPAQSSSSLTRDLNALEAGGLLLATPAAGEPRQGRPVQFRLAPGVPALFGKLGQRLTDASTLAHST